MPYSCKVGHCVVCILGVLCVNECVSIIYSVEGELWVYTCVKCEGVNLIEVSDMESIADDAYRWFVMNAYKSEMKAEEALSEEAGLTYFIPKRYVARKYRGRMKRVLVPVIPNLVFVRARYEELEQFKQKHPFLRYATRRIDGANRIMKVPDEQMDNFIKAASHYEEEITYYNPDEIALEKGTRVRVIGGPFDGVEGVLLKVKGKRSKRVVIAIKDVAAISVAEISPELLQILKD